MKTIDPKETDWTRVEDKFPDERVLNPLVKRIIEKISEYEYLVEMKDGRICKWISSENTPEVL